MVVAPLGTLKPAVYVQTLGCCVLTGILWGLHETGWWTPSLPLAFHEVGGALMALTLGFRANAAYARFWEGRTLWGGIVNASRNLHRLLATHGGAQLGADTAPWIALFAHSTKRTLRGEPIAADAERLLPADRAADLAGAPHPALHAARALSEHIQAASGELGPAMTHRAEQELSALVDRLGGCERILKTPTPVGFVVLVRQIVLAFLVTLPLSIVDELSAWSVLVVGLVAFPVFAIEALGSELDDPFGRDPNDLPLDRITETIERDVTEQAAASTRYGVVVS